MNRAIVRDDASRQKTLSTSASIQEAEQGTNSKAAPDENGDDHSAVPDGGEKQRDEEGGGLELSRGDENQTSTGNALLEAKESKRTADPETTPSSDDDGVEVNDALLKEDDDKEAKEEGEDTKQAKMTDVNEKGQDGIKTVEEAEEKSDEQNQLFMKSFEVVKLVSQKLNKLAEASATIGEEINEHAGRIDMRKTRFKRLVIRMNQDLKKIREGLELIKTGAETIEGLGGGGSESSGGATS